MVKLILHIGQPKTGSTAIQQTLNRNRRILIDHYQILYPNFHANNFDERGYSNHANFFRSFILNNQKDLIIQVLKECKEFCIANDINQLIISSEGFFEQSWVPKFFRQVKDEVFEEICIVLYLRRQDFWVESAWKQWGIKDQKYKAIQDFIQNRRMNWYHSISKWLELFDKSAFVVRPFEKETIRKNVVEDFLTLVGFKNEKIIDLKTDLDQNANPGFKPEIIEILKNCNYLAVDIHDNRITNILQKALSGKFIRQSPFSSYGLLSPNERYEIVKKYDDSNREIAKIFFGHERENLFNEPWPDPNEKWEPTGSLSVEKVVQISMELFLYQQNKLIALEAEVSELKKSKSQSITLSKSNQEKKMLLQNIDISQYSFDSVKLTQMAKKINFANQITSVNVNETNFELSSIGDDPYFLINTSLIPRNVRALKIDITVPTDTFFQLFYKTFFFKGFNEVNSVGRYIYAGRHTFVIILPKRRLSKSLRFDPGNSPGKYIIHTIEIGRQSNSP